MPRLASDGTTKDVVAETDEIATVASSMEFPSSTPMKVTSEGPTSSRPSIGQSSKPVATALTGVPLSPSAGPIVN